jgi:hypothetical protein
VNLLGQTTLGIIVLLLLGMLVIVKRAATGDILDRPQGNLLVQLVNIFWINVVLILLLIPLEEDGLLKAYREQYVAYQLPFLKPISHRNK